MMDPDACLKALLDALRDDKRWRAKGNLEDLLGWIEKGGFLPKDPRLNAGQEAAMAAAEHLRVAAGALIDTAATYERMAKEVKHTNRG
jgi:hypothetical protein